MTKIIFKHAITKKHQASQVIVQRFKRLKLNMRKLFKVYSTLPNFDILKFMCSLFHVKFEFVQIESFFTRLI